MSTWVLVVACPHCGVPRGAQCVTPGGRRRQYVHAVRVTAAEAAYDSAILRALSSRTQ